MKLAASLVGLGIGLLLTGVFLLSLPAGLIVAGAVAVAAGSRLEV